MHVAVVFAHPGGTSFGRAILEAALRGLRAAGHEVEVLDLYGQDVAAAMSLEEHRAYHGADPIVDPTVAEHAALVRRAQMLVFVYPTWWAGLPAILKGWLERVMVPGVGFVFDRRGKVRPGLTHVRRIVGISTYGSPRPYVALVNDNGRRVLMRALRLNTGWRTRRTWLGMYGVDTSTRRDRERFVARVERTAAAL